MRSETISTATTISATATIQPATTAATTPTLPATTSTWATRVSKCEPGSWSLLWWGHVTDFIRVTNLALALRYAKH